MLNLSTQFRRYVHTPSASQVRHRDPLKLESGRKIIVACPPMKSNVNLSYIARSSSCYGVKKLVLCGTSKLLPHVSRQAEDQENGESNDIEVAIHRSLEPVLKKLKNEEGYTIVGLEQTTKSECMYNFKWPHKVAIVVGHESKGLPDNIINMCDHLVEITQYGLPYSLNVSHALTIALYEYSKQYPKS